MQYILSNLYKLKNIHGFICYFLVEESKKSYCPLSLKVIIDIWDQ